MPYSFLESNPCILYAVVVQECLCKSLAESLSNDSKSCVVGLALTLGASKVHLLGLLVKHLVAIIVIAEIAVPKA